MAPPAPHEAGKRAAVAASTLLFWVLVSALPIYNKRVFACFPYPVATTLTQLAASAVLLIVANVLEWACDARLRARIQTTARQPLLQGASPPSPFSTDMESNGAAVSPVSPMSTSSAGGDTLHKSWVFGPGLFEKVRICTPVGVLFGLKFSLTNIGLQVLPTTTHVLLQATDIVWTVVAAWLLNKERPVSAGDWVACALSLVGSTCLAIQLSADFDEPRAMILPVLINLTSPALLGLCFATLRRATLRFAAAAERIGEISSIEITCLKLAIATVTTAIIAIGLEGPAAQMHPFWSALWDGGAGVLALVLGGALLISVYQVNCTWLTYMTSTLTVGIVSGIKIVPQWIGAALVNGSPSMGRPMSAAGIVSLILSGVLWAVSRSGALVQQPKPLPRLSITPRRMSAPRAPLQSQALIKHLRERATTIPMPPLAGAPDSGDSGTCLEYAAALLRYQTARRVLTRSRASSIGSNSSCPLPPVEESGEEEGDSGEDIPPTPSESDLSEYGTRR